MRPWQVLHAHWLSTPKSEERGRLPNGSLVIVIAPSDTERRHNHSLERTPPQREFIIGLAQRRRSARGR